MPETVSRLVRRHVKSPLTLIYGTLWDAMGTPGTVELRGIEPLTSSMPWKRSTN